MDINNLMGLVSEKLQNEEDRMRLARLILEDKSSLTKQTAFLSKKDGSLITLDEFIEKEGYDAALRLVMSMLESLSENEPGTLKQFTSDDINDILARVNNGEGSDEDMAIAKMFEDGHYADTLKEQNSQNMMHMILKNMFDMIYFVMEEKHYTPMLADFTAMMELLISESLILTPSSALYSFKDIADPKAIVNVGKEVCEDMQKACFSTIWKDKAIKHEYIIMGLLAWLNQLVSANEYECAHSQDIIDHMGIGDAIVLEDEKAQETESPEVVQPICHGSNDGKIVSFENTRVMRNLLKDD